MIRQLPPGVDLGELLRFHIANPSGLKRILPAKGLSLEERSDPILVARKLALRLRSANEGECWIWDGGHTKGGYGTLHIADTSNMTHRIAYVLANGPIPDGLHVLHSCDTPPCCNTSHMSLGTARDNQRDANIKGRNSRGSDRWNSILNEENVIVIKRLISEGVHDRIIAARFGVHHATVGDIRRGATWKHVA